MAKAHNTETGLGVTLHMTTAEAATVRDILGHVSGQMDTRRKLANNVYDTLDAALGDEPTWDDLGGNVEFETK